MSYRSAKNIANEIVSILYGEDMDPVETAKSVKREFAEMDRVRNRKQREVTPLKSIRQMFRKERGQPLPQPKEEKIDAGKILHHINNFSYKLINIPDIMSKRSEYELSELTGGPVKLPFGYEVGQGRFSINWMIQSFAKGVPFEFVNWEDCVEVVKDLNIYISILEKDLKQIDNELKEVDVKDINSQAFDKAVAYLHMAKELNATLEPLSKRLINYYTTTPTIEERIEETELEMRKRKLGIIIEKNKDMSDKLRYTQQLLDKLHRGRRN